MNLPKIYLIVTLLVAIGVVAKGQEPPKAVLFSEFGGLPCGQLHAQTDVFAEESKRDATSHAVILIYPPTVRPEQATRIRTQISSFLQLRGLSTDRFSFYKANNSSDDQTIIQFWLLGPDGELPFRKAVLWNEEPPDLSSTFVFGYEDEINICPTFVPAAYAKLILENPGSIGRVIVRRSRDSTEYPSYFAARLIKELVEEHKVPRKRLRLIFRNGKELAAEFWFVPKR